MLESPDTPTTAHVLGREAFFAGQPESNCPYPERSPERRAWLGAFRAARLFREWMDQHLAREG